MPLDAMLGSYMHKFIYLQITASILVWMVAEIFVLSEHARRCLIKTLWYVHCLIVMTK